MSVDFMAQWPVKGEEWPEIGETVNCNNGNAKALLEVLGYDASWPPGGEDWPEEFLVRVRRALIIVRNVSGADAGTPCTESGGPGTGRPRWVEGGRRPGFFVSRLRDLQAVAEAAAQHDGGMVVWA